jgi:hypothetical protein
VANICNKCGKEVGLFSGTKVDKKLLCSECAKADTVEKNIPDIDSIRRALSALLTQDPDTQKLFEKGSRTYVKLFGGDINNFINLNSNLVQASILLKILEKLEKIETFLEKEKVP